MGGGGRAHKKKLFRPGADLGHLGGGLLRTSAQDRTGDETN